VDEYTEMIPTGGGGHAAGGGGSQTKHLPPAVHSQVYAEGGSVAPVLERVATSSKLGAPQRTLSEREEIGAPASKSGSRGSNFVGRIDLSPLREATGSVSDDAGADRLRGLLVLLGLVGFGGLAVSVRRRRHGL
jgi:hypothetical protein